MILNNVQSVIYNGATASVWANGTMVWPSVPSYSDIVCDNSLSANIGLTATKNGQVVFSQEPTSASFTASDIPAGSELLCSMEVPQYKKYDVTGFTRTSRTVDIWPYTGSSVDYLTAIANGPITIGNEGLVDNVFEFSGTSHNSSCPPSKTYRLTNEYLVGITYCSDWSLLTTGFYTAYLDGYSLVGTAYWPVGKVIGDCYGSGIISSYNLRPATTAQWQFYCPTSYVTAAAGFSGDYPRIDMPYNESGTSSSTWMLSAFSANDRLSLHCEFSFAMQNGSAYSQASATASSMYYMSGISQ